MSLTDLPEFLTVSETARELRCHVDTVTSMVKRGELRAVRLGRAVRIVAESIRTLAASNADSEVRGES